MDDWGGLIGLGLIIFIIYIIVKYVIPIVVGLATIILTIFAGIGIIIGSFLAIRNFIASITDVRDKRSYLGQFISKEIQNRVHNEASNGDYSAYVYEKCARKFS